MATPMKIRKLVGCCAADVLYNLGGSHGWPRADTQYEFDSWVAKKWLEETDVCIAVTDRTQTAERKYLANIGFDNKEIDGLQLHSISGTDLRRYIYRHHLKPREVIQKRERRFDW